MSDDGPSIKVPALPELTIGPGRTGTDPSDRSPTFADVAMRLVVDGPVYSIILVVGVLAYRGTASTAEAVIAALAALLSKSWPRPVQMGTHTAIILALGAQLAWSW